MGQVTRLEDAGKVVQWVTPFRTPF
jgi:hypothetical protein